MNARWITGFLLCGLLIGAACSGSGNDDDDTASNDDDVSVPDCSVLTGVAGQSVINLTHDGLERSFRLLVPDSYDPASPTPLVLNLHGGGSVGVIQEALSGMPEKAQTEGFITASPESSDGSWNFGITSTSANAAGVDDVGFALAVIERIEAEWCVDPRRVYATGHSQGGALSMRLACEEPERVAAVAPVSAVMALEGCSGSRGVSIMMFHGVLDEPVPYNGGREGYPSVPETFAFWGELNQCTDTPTETFANGDTTCMSYQDCADDAVTTLCSSEEASHSWPGSTVNAPGEVTTQAIDATEAMWEFFVAHPMER